MMNKWDRRFLLLAKQISTWSKDPSTQVGAVLVRPNKTICSVGFNGFPAGFNDSPKLYNDRELKYKAVKHAEENAILFSSEPIDGYTMYVYPLAPCSLCAGDMAQKSIGRVVTMLSEKGRSRFDGGDTFDYVLTRQILAGKSIEFVIYDEHEVVGGTAHGAE